MNENKRKKIKTIAFEPWMIEEIEEIVRKRENKGFVTNFSVFVRETIKEKLEILSLEEEVMT